MKKSYIRFANLSHARGAKTVFHDITAQVNGGDVVGLIGDNGTGKSTLLHILHHDIEPDTGTIEKKGTVGLVTQGLEEGDARTVGEYLAEGNEFEEWELLVGLGKAGGDDVRLEQKLHTLSGGQRTKVRIAKQLIDNVDILLLDEPTNHLDDESTQSLIGLVKRFHGPVIVVSHDRGFLDAACTHIYDLNLQHLEVYSGNYMFFLEEREQRYEAQLREWKLQERERKAMELRLADLKQRASVYDNPRRGKLLRSRTKMYERQFGEQKIQKPTESSSMQMAMHGGKHKRKKICRITAGPIHVGGRNLYEIDEMEILGKDRIILRGANGSGKTTLLKQLKRTAESGEENQRIHRGNDIHIAFFDQHDSVLLSEESVSSRASREFPDSRSENVIRSKLVGAGVPSEDLSRLLQKLSYGQRVKLRFLQMMIQKVDFLILDEPTNHLDIATRESLEGMLQNYEGALLVVSHDQWFVEQIGVEKEWKIDEGICLQKDVL